MSQVLIVTGGGRGIGAATARLGAAQGYRVCVNYRQDAEAANGLVAEIEAAGGRAIAVAADVSRREAVAALFQVVDQTLGPVTALVNNAGFAGRVDRIEDAAPETIEAVIDANLKGTIWCCREGLRRMAKRHGGPGGAIVNISSGAATLGSPGEYIWYAASKAAIDALTIGLAKETAGEGVRVNAVAPGFVDTHIHADSGLPNRLAEDGPKVPLGRAADPAEIARPILWLLSDAASYTTGAVLRVAGGR